VLGRLGQRAFVREIAELHLQQGTLQRLLSNFIAIANLSHDY
jgi:hypothetical protein